MVVAKSAEAALASARDGICEAGMMQLGDQIDCGGKGAGQKNDVGCGIWVKIPVQEGGLQAHGFQTKKLEGRGETSPMLESSQSSSFFSRFAKSIPKTCSSGGVISEMTLRKMRRVFLSMEILRDDS